MKFYTLYSLLMFASFSYSQSAQGKKDNLFWFGYYNSIVLNAKFDVNSDAQFRTKEGLSKPSQAIIRSALVYKPSQKLSLSAGFAHFRYYLDNVVTRGEWRPWQEAGIKHVSGKVKFSNKLRIEQRFNQEVKNNRPVNEYAFNWRFRYKADVQVPVFELFTKNVVLVAGNELMYQAFSGNDWKFDQDRIFAGLNYEQNRNLTIQVQFTYIFQKQTNTTLIDEYSVIRFNILHTIRYERDAK